MFTIENHVGRLIELRMTSPMAIEDLAGFHEAVSRVVEGHGNQVVGVTDLLSARVFPQPVTDRLTLIIRQESPRVERNAILVGEGAVFSMQTERIIRDAAMPNRRAFRNPNDLSAWLGEVLNAAERRRLLEFMRESAQRARSTK
jgi:hypothetical protein